MKINKEKDIRDKKKLLRDFGFVITKEIEDHLESAESDIKRENYVLGILKDFFDKKEEAERNM